MAVLKNVENKIKLVMVVSSLFLIGCIIVSLESVCVGRQRSNPGETNHDG